MNTFKPGNRLNQYIASASISLDRFRDDIRGVSGLEFAIIAPMLIGVWLGFAETALGVSNSRKVSRVAATLADLVSQAEVIDSTAVEGIMNAATAIMAPYDASPLKIFVVGVKIDSSGVAKVAWSKARNATAPSVGSSYNIPSQIRFADTFLIVTNVTYAYTPAIGGNLVNTFNFNETNYNVPRTSAVVKYVGS